MCSLCYTNKYLHEKSISKDCFISMYLVINALRKFSLCSIIGDHCCVGVYQFYCFPLMYVKLVKYFLLCWMLSVTCYTQTYVGIFNWQRPSLIDLKLWRINFLWLKMKVSEQNHHTVTSWILHTPFHLDSYHLQGNSVYQILPSIHSTHIATAVWNLSVQLWITGV